MLMKCCILLKYQFYRFSILKGLVLILSMPGRVTQLERCLTADPGVVGLIPALSHTLAEIDHEIISIAILLPSADSS